MDRMFIEFGVFHPIKIFKILLLLSAFFSLRWFENVVWELRKNALAREC